MLESPTRTELLAAVRGFLESLVPELEGVRRFHARVAAHALAIVERELELGPEASLRAYRRLAALLDEPAPAPADPGEREAAVARLEAELARRIRAGEADTGPRRAAILEHLRATTLERLAIDRPGYAGTPTEGGLP